MKRGGGLKPAKVVGGFCAPVCGRGSQRLRLACCMRVGQREGVACVFRTVAVSMEMRSFRSYKEVGVC